MRLATPRDQMAVLDRLRSDTVRTVSSLLRDLPRDYPGAGAWLKGRLRDCLGGRAESWIAEVDSSPAGVVILTPKPTALKLSTIYVEPRFRGLGVGTQLMDHALGRAALRQVDEIYVTVAQHTVPLLRPLLDSRGFTCVALERHRYGLGRHEAIFSRLEK